MLLKSTAINKPRCEELTHVFDQCFGMNMLSRPFQKIIILHKEKSELLKEGFMASHGILMILLLVQNHQMLRIS